MRPDAEAPLVAADEVGMVVGNSQIVNRRYLGCFPNLLQAHGNTFVRYQPIACLQFLGATPALAQEIKRMLGCRTDDAAINQECQRRRDPDNQLLNDLRRRLDGVSLWQLVGDSAFSRSSAWALRWLMATVRDAALEFARRHGNDEFLAAIERLAGG
jgi:hypothetical protein